MLKQFLKYIFQSIAGMVGISIYILADTFFISLYAGADGLTVLNMALPIYGLIFAIGSMIGIGSATRYGIAKAREEHTDFYFTQSVMWCICISIPFIAAGVLAPDRVLMLMGADAGLTELGRTYLRIVLIATPFFMSNYTFTAFARNDQAPTTAMIGSIAGSTFNVIFDYIFMFPMGMGMAGAALATALSPVVTMTVCTTHYLGKNNQVGFAVRGLSPRHFLACCQLGMSAFVGEISSAVITVIFNMLILDIAGNVGVAAFGVIANLSAVAMAIFNGLSQGIQPLVSEKYGQNQMHQVKQLRKWSLIVCLVIEAEMLAIAVGMTDMLIGIFNSEQNAQLLKIAHTGLRLYFLGFLFAGINIVMIAYYSAIDHARPAMIGSLMRGLIAISGCAIILSRFFGLDGVWLSFLASEIITFGVMKLCNKI